jgi:predicted  nucleic acid-binding Zn ribbon protein
MYIHEITLNLSPDLDADLLVDEFNWLMSSYHKNGQILSGAQTQYITGRKIICLPYTLEEDSLSAKYNNSHVNKQVKRLEDLCNAKIEFRIIGNSSEHHNEVCTCKSQSAYYLTALSFSRDSGVMCGDCRLSVPLYKLPKTDDDNYTSILNWQLSSMICDGFDIINLKTEIPSLPNSVLLSLDKLGFEICENIELKTGIKTRLFHKLGKDKKSGKSSGKEIAE